MVSLVESLASKRKSLHTYWLWTDDNGLKHDNPLKNKHKSWRGTTTTQPNESKRQFRHRKQKQRIARGDCMRIRGDGKYVWGIRCSQCWCWCFCFGRWRLLFPFTCLSTHGLHLNGNRWLCTLQNGNSARALESLASIGWVIVVPSSTYLELHKQAQIKKNPSRGKENMYAISGRFMCRPNTNKRTRLCSSK